MCKLFCALNMKTASLKLKYLNLTLPVKYWMSQARFQTLALSSFRQDIYEEFNFQISKFKYA